MFLKKSYSLLVNVSTFFSSHCQMVRTFQPFLFSDAIFVRSLARFVFIFPLQKSTRVLGSRAYRQPVCSCQEHPFTKITFLRPANTKSGFPGRFLPCNLYRYPMPKIKRRTAISGLVFFDLTRLISQPRRWGVNLSTFYPARQNWLSTLLQTNNVIPPTSISSSLPPLTVQDDVRRTRVWSALPTLRDSA